jgi:hypothetical protein
VNVRNVANVANLAEHIPSFVPSLATITREVDDVLRYTVVLPHGKYTAGVRSIVDALTGEPPLRSGGGGSGGIATDVYAMNYWCEKKNCTTYLVRQIDFGEDSATGFTQSELTICRFSNNLSRSPEQVHGHQLFRECAAAEITGWRTLRVRAAISY